MPLGRYDERGRFVPFHDRTAIENGALAGKGLELAWAADPIEFFFLQVQGSGRLRAPDGTVIRIGYAEQNGQPFRPTLAQGPGGKSQVRTRGASIELELDDEDDVGDIGAVRTRGFTLARPVASGAVLVPGQRTSGPVTGSGIKDPSYVFFKEVQTNTAGPVGAMGVPLQPGRSIAVDPRSTPLGYPVFVSTRQPGSGTPMQRLTIAQDTGGAIRGAVRADYFFGNGQLAANQARRMKERGQLWILLPRGQAVAAASTSTLPGLRTRGASLANCLVPDDETCAD